MTNKPDQTRQLVLQIISALATSGIIGLAAWQNGTDRQVQANTIELENRASAIMTAKANATEIALLKQAVGQQGRGVNRILKLLREKNKNGNEE